jgi:hypothetical protein
MDMALFTSMAPAFGSGDGYILATRDSRATMETLLRAEMQRLSKEEAEDADNDTAAEQRRRLEAG